MNIAQMIDHTLLRADATKQEIARLIAEAKEYHFASVCVNPVWVSFAAQELQGTDVKVCTVIGFPLGAATTAVKAFEANDAVANGAAEIDMVINIGAVKDGEYGRVLEDIQQVVAAAGHAIVKVIIETCLLTDEEKVRVTELVVQAGAHFVKTSTGFSTGGATLEDVAILRKAAGPKFGVKAAGGIRSIETAKAMLEAGATRIGTSSGTKFVQAE